ncbi:AraC family transcriptional regulator ligand-binding domain-containing protein [Streptomyces sp. NPDC101160]|uniref:AraC family transcriptional regulator n=1 Tax=Streptomyces sp. NPDC101160 TaxID=3366118 RepID=UPI0037F87F59
MPPATPSALPGLSVSSHHVRAVLLGAQRHGVDPAPLLARAGLPAELPARVPARRFGRLVGTLWRRLDDELIGFGEAPSRFGTFATMAELVVRGSHDLREALHRGQDFYGLFPAGPRFRLVEPAARAGGFAGELGGGFAGEFRGELSGGVGGEFAGGLWGGVGGGFAGGLSGALSGECADEARIEFDVSGYDDPVRFGAETTVVVTQRFAGWLIGRRLGLRRVEFGYPEPRHAPEYAPLFRAPCVFGAPRTAVVFDRADLDAAVCRDAAALRALLRRITTDVLVCRDDHGTRTVTTRVRHLIFAALPAGPVPPPEEIAHRLAVSPQTLRRRLAAEGTSYQRLRDQVRRDHALAALTRDALSIEDLSQRLGFSEPSAFHRAFRRWTGSTPRAYQRRREPTARSHPSERGELDQPGQPESVARLTAPMLG